MPRISHYAALGLLATSLAACSSFHHDDQPQTGTLTRHLTMIGEDGKRYGTVDMDPIGGGKVYDSTGALIATLTPASGGYAVAPATTGYAAPAYTVPDARTEPVR